MSDLRKKLRRQRAHERNRVNDIARKNGLTTTTTTMTTTASTGKVVRHETKKSAWRLVCDAMGDMLSGNTEHVAMRQAGLTDVSVSQANVQQACVAMIDLIRRNGNGESRKQVMVHLPGEMRKVLVGRTSQEAYDFYWSITAFRTVWEMLGFTVQTLKDFVNTQARAVDKPLL